MARTRRKKDTPELLVEEVERPEVSSSAGLADPLSLEDLQRNTTRPRAVSPGELTALLRDVPVSLEAQYRSLLAGLKPGVAGWPSPAALVFFAARSAWRVRSLVDETT